MDKEKHREVLAMLQELQNEISANDSRGYAVVVLTAEGIAVACDGGGNKDTLELIGGLTLVSTTLARAYESSKGRGREH